MARVLESGKRLHRFIGRWRLWWGFCPRCNSDAPAVDWCYVCRSYIADDYVIQEGRRQQYPPSRATKALWRHVWTNPAMTMLFASHERRKVAQKPEDA